MPHAPARCRRWLGTRAVHSELIGHTSETGAIDGPTHGRAWPAVRDAIQAIARPTLHQSARARQRGVGTSGRGDPMIAIPTLKDVGASVKSAA